MEFDTTFTFGYLLQAASMSPLSIQSAIEGINVAVSVFPGLTQLVLYSLGLTGLYLMLVATATTYWYLFVV